MSEINTILEKFEEIIKQNPANHVEKGTTEVVFLLYKTDWVRIFVSRDITNSKAVVIDVEVSVPSIESSGTSSTKLDKGISIEIRSLLETFNEHIKYILALERSGFLIDFIGNGCLLLATKCFENKPNPEIFRLLSPPQSVEH